MNLINSFDKKTKTLLMISGIGLGMTLLIIEWLLAPGLSLLFFDIMVISFVTWFGGRWSALTLSAAIAGVLIIKDAQSGAGGVPLLLYWNTVMKLAIFIIFAQLLAALKRSLEHEKDLTTRDMLTGVPNRKFFYELALQELHRSRRYKHPFTVAYVDIDNFKMINYRFGHSGGDKLLHTVAQIIRNHIRDVDVVSRLGGDEFAILLPETGAEGSQIVFSRLRKELLDSMKANSWPVTFSFGVVTFITPPASVEDMVKKASIQMYAAKNSGANTIDQEIFATAA